MSNPSIAHALRRLLDTVDLAALDPDDRAALQAAASPADSPTAAPDPDAAPRPLWSWLREGALRFRGLIRWSPFDDDEWRDLLLDAGAERDALDTAAARMTARVTRAALRTAIVRRLHAPADHSGRAIAAWAAGLAGMTELTADLVEASSRRTDGLAWLDTTAHAAAFQALLMLDAPALASMAPALARDDDRDVRNVAALWCLLHPDADHGPERVAALMNTPEERIVAAFPEAFIALDVPAAALEDHLDSLLVPSLLQPAVASAVARIAVHRGWERSLRRLLRHDEPEMRGRAVVEAAWSRAAWTAPLLREQLESETDEAVQTCLVAALGTVAPDAEAWLLTQLALDDSARRHGVIWAAFGAPERGHLLDAAGGLWDPTALHAARCIRASHGGIETAPWLEVETAALFAEREPLIQRLCARAFAAHGTPPTPAVAEWHYRHTFVRAHPAGDAHAFYRAFPALLTAAVHDPGGWRACAIAGLLGGDTLRDALEDVVISARDHDTQVSAYAELCCLGGARTAAGRAVGAWLCRGVPDSRSASALALGAVFAARGDAEQRALFAGRLHDFGADAEPVLTALLLHERDDDVLPRALDAAMALPSPRGALLRDLQRLTRGTLDSLSEIAASPHLARLAPPAALRRWIGHCKDREQPLEAALAVLLPLLNHRDPDVATAALEAVIERAGATPWVRGLLDARSQGSDRSIQWSAVSLMGTSRDAHWVPRLMKILADDDADVDATTTAIALRQIAQAHPELGLIVLTADPSSHAWFGPPGLKRGPSGELASELVAALEASADPRRALVTRGRRVLLRTGVEASAVPPAGERFGQAEFDSLGIFLRVVFADDATSAIVAEVGEERTGEVVNALLQTAVAAAAVGEWA